MYRISRTVTRTVGGALCAATLLLGAACTSGSGDEPADKASASKAATDKKQASDDKAKGSDVPGATDVPSKITNEPKLRKDVSVESCKADGDQWEAKGTAKNSTDEARAYTITIFFATERGTVLAFDQTKTDVLAADADTDTEWSVKTGVPADAGKVMCVLRGVS